MQRENRFIKLLLFSVAEEQILLYGFSSPTSQPRSSWKQKTVPKKRQSVLTSILPFEEAEQFEDCLTREGSLPVARTTLKVFPLMVRPMVLVNDGHTLQRGPVAEYAHLQELWNVQKEGLFRQVLQAFGTDGRELYRDVQDLIQWCREECGIDFSFQGHRFGNFEHYQPAALGTGFEVLTHKELGLKKVTVQKTAACCRPLVVNCAAEHRGRWLINQTKLLAPEESCVAFTAEEPMSRMAVQIWDQETGELLFANDTTLTMEIHISANYSSSAYRITDSWTKKLLQSASNRKKEIQDGIETVHRVTNDRPISIRSNFRTEMDDASETGDRLLAEYQKPRALGAFIPNTGKDGEIDSFLKIRSYLDDPSVDRAIIADPYFSVQAAEKLLARIPRTNMQLDILTCYGVTDPDTGEVSDVCKKAQKFLHRNAGLLHSKLTVRNLWRGGNQVFHDRYLLRFHQDHQIDGFLLSNSLNSMGQNYPFVIAPMEHEVALEVCEYLTQLCDPDIQNRKPKKERIHCDVIYDSAANVAARNQPPKEPSPSPMEGWLGPAYVENGGRHIPKEELPAAVAELWSHWEQNPEGVCRTLGELCSTVFPWSTEDVAQTLKTINGATETFLTWFSAFAREKEQHLTHDQNGINDPEYILWALLHDRAKASRAGFHILFDDAGHIWYPEDGWLHGTYCLLLELDPAAFLSLLEDSSSPLMFDVLAARMAFYPWSERIFLSASKSALAYVQLLGAQWMFSLRKNGKRSDQQILEALSQLTPQTRSLQAAYLLSQIVFFARINQSLTPEAREAWQQFRQTLLSLLAADLPSCSQQERDLALSWLYDTEPCSQCRLQLGLSQRLNDPGIRDAVLQKAVDGMQNHLLHSLYGTDLDTPVSLYLACAEKLYGDSTEKQILGKVVDWETFERAAEPELKNYSYQKWHSAYRRAKWQLRLLALYAQRHPEAEKTLKWLKEWSSRLPDAANDQPGT